METHITNVYLDQADDRIFFYLHQSTGNKHIIRLLCIDPEKRVIQHLYLWNQNYAIQARLGHEILLLRVESDEEREEIRVQSEQGAHSGLNLKGYIDQAQLQTMPYKLHVSQSIVSLSRKLQRQQVLSVFSRVSIQKKYKAHIVKRVYEKIFQNK